MMRALLKFIMPVFIVWMPLSSAHANSKFLVILDPGHGGEDVGAIRTFHGKQIAEKDLTLAIAFQTSRILQQKGIATLLTRSRDTYVSLDKRPEIANRAAENARSSVFVSIHLNSSEESKSTGIETYVFNAATNEASKRLADLENGKRWSQNHATLDLILSDLATTGNYSESADLACQIQKSAIQKIKPQNTEAKDRGIRQALFYVLMQTRMPSVLFEPGFVSNPHELSRLTNPAYQKSLAEALANGILKWKLTNIKKVANSMRKLSAIRKTVDSNFCQIH